MTETFHPKHLQLLHHLRRDAREKLTDISKKTHIPISTLFDLLKELQGSVIRQSTILLHFDQLGYHTRAHVFLKVSPLEKEKVRTHLFHHVQVNSVYKINNGWDFIVETVHKNNRELDEFLENLSGKFKIENKEIHYILEDVKKEGFSLASDTDL